MENTVNKIKIRGKTLTGIIILLMMFVSITIAQDTRPNFVIILTDDQRWNAMQAMGNDIIQTPEMDKMAEEGVMFNNAYVTTAICFASRGSIVLGQYAERAGVNTFGYALSQDQIDHTYYTLLQDAGYYIGHIGKWHLAAAGLADCDYRNTVWNNYNQQDSGQYCHLTRFMGNRAMDFFNGIPDDRPFLLMFNTKAPHAQDNNPAGDQFHPDPDLLPLYENDTIPVPPTADPAFFDAMPDFLKDQNTEMRIRWRLRFEGDLFEDGVKDYFRLVTGVDIQIKRIRDRVEQLGVADNTVLILTGDNGMFLGERGYAGKWLSHEHSIRVPLVVVDPRLDDKFRGMRRDEIALNIDLAPTILSYAGIDAPARMQGHDLTPLIYGQATQWRSDFFHEHLWTNGRIPRNEALVGSQYKYIVYPDNPNYEELYDFVNDPWEMENLINSAEYSAVLDSMKARFDALKQSVRNDDDVDEILMDVGRTDTCMDEKACNYAPGAAIACDDCCRYLDAQGGCTSPVLAVEITTQDEPAFQFNPGRMVVNSGIPHTVEIINISGENVFSQSGSGPAEYEIQHLKPGVHTVRITIEKQTLTKRIIVLE